MTFSKRIWPIQPSSGPNNVTLTMLRHLAAILLLATIIQGNSTEECTPCGSTNEGDEGKIIKIGVLLNEKTAVEAMPVIFLARQELREKELLKDYNISIVYRDTECSSTIGPLKAFELFAECVDVFLGPVCDYALAPVCRYSKYWKIPVLSPGGKPGTMDADPGAAALTRLNGHDSQLAATLLTICKEYDWGHVGLLYEDNEDDGKGRSACHLRLSTVYEHFRNNNITSVPIGFKNSSNLNEPMLELSIKSRVIFFCVINKDNVKRLMIEAKSLHLTSEKYVFFNVDLDAGPAELYRPWGDDESAKPAFSAMFTVASHTPKTDYYRNFSNKVRNLSVDKGEEELHELLTKITFKSNSSGLITPFIASFYEGVMLYVEAFKRTIEKKDIRSQVIPRTVTNDINAEIVNSTYYSHLKNRSITLQNNTIPDDYAVYKKETNGDYKEVAQLLSPSKNEKFKSPLGVYDPGEKIPKDGPQCGYNGEKCPKGPKLLWVIILLLLLVVVLVIFSVIVIRKYRLERQISSMSWKIDYNDIVFNSEQGVANNNFGSVVSLGRVSQHTLQSMTSVDSLNNRQIFTKSGIYKGNRVAIKHLNPSKVDLTRPLLLELKALKEVSSEYLVRVIGACFDSPNNCFITEYCPRGSLQDVLENDTLNLEDMFKYSLLHDLTKGLAHLHSSEIKVHGNLKSTNCVVDSRLVLKITDFGVLSLRGSEEGKGACLEEYQHYRKKLWSAPELLRQSLGELSQDQIQMADLYSVGIIMNEIFCRKGPFPLQDDNEMLSPKEIIRFVEAGDDPLLRPHISDEVDQGVLELMERCWHEDPNQRPSISTIKKLVRKWNKNNESGNILDNLLNRMVLYSENLESLVAERTKDYLEEKKKCEEVLYQLLPQSVARQLIAGLPVIAKTYDCVTIYFSDIVGFTALSAASTPMQIVDMLNSLYSLFDKTISPFDVYKVETIGDAYMVVSGLPVTNGNNHVGQVASMALKLLEAVKSFQIPHNPDQELRLRIGLHSGPCVAGVVGVKMPRYCLFGDTVNTASRMESNGLPMKIHVSSSTYNLLTQLFTTYQLELRGQVEMKGKGVVTTYWLLGEDGFSKRDGTSCTAVELAPEIREWNHHVPAADETQGTLRNSLQNSCLPGTETSNYTDDASTGVVVTTPHHGGDEQICTQNSTEPDLIAKHNNNFTEQNGDCENAVDLLSFPASETSSGAHSIVHVTFSSPIPRENNSSGKLSNLIDNRRPLTTASYSIPRQVEDHQSLTLNNLSTENFSLKSPLLNHFGDSESRWVRQCSSLPRSGVKKVTFLQGNESCTSLLTNSISNSIV